MEFPGWKISLITFMCLLGILFAAPSILPSSVVDGMPEWVRSIRINLGLDLKGGSHILLEIDTKYFAKEQTDSLLQNIRFVMQHNKAGYTNLRVLEDWKIGFALKDANTDIGDILHEFKNSADIKRQDNEVTVSFGEAFKKEQYARLLSQSVEIVRRRVDETGLTEPSIQTEGGGRIMLQVPGLSDPAQLKRILGKTAKLTFHIVTGDMNIRGGNYRIPIGSHMVVSDRKGDNSQYIIGNKALLSGDMLKDVKVSMHDNEPVVYFQLDQIGSRKFAEATRNNVGKFIAIILDDKAVSVAQIREPITGGSGTISGNFTMQSASDLVLLLRAGALPAPINIIEEKIVGPSLGSDSVQCGIRASIAGMAGVMMFMLLSYHYLGIIANVALALNIVFIIATLALFRATLTMPGIAGIVLTMGMAVDANVLIFERIREELRRKVSIYAAVERGFDCAFGAILDSNVTTLLIAFLLFYFGSGTIKGFAITLCIGIMASMFSAITVTKLMIIKWLQFRRVSFMAL